MDNQKKQNHKYKNTYNTDNLTSWSRYALLMVTCFSKPKIKLCYNICTEQDISKLTSFMFYLIMSVLSSAPVWVGLLLNPELFFV